MLKLVENKADSAASQGTVMHPTDDGPRVAARRIKANLVEAK
jgi:hypothetical protein